MSARVQRAPIAVLQNTRTVIRPVRRKQTTPASDFRLPIMLELSDTSKKKWEIVQGQWEVCSYKYSPDGEEDGFHNYPKYLFELFNKITKNRIWMGRYDVVFLFPDWKEMIKTFSRGKGKELRLYKCDPIDLKSTDSALRVIVALKRLCEIGEIELAKRFSSIFFSANVLNKEEKRRILQIATSLMPPNEVEITPQMRNFLMYKPLEACTDYYGLKDLSYLQAVLDEEHTHRINRERSTIENRLRILTKSRSRSSFDNAFDRELRNEREKLRKTKLTYLQIYEMECKYRESVEGPSLELSEV